MDKIKPLFTANATATGGRNGHTEASDGSVKADLSVPKAMGGPGKPGTTTPEHLFAAGYAACFGGALDFVAKARFIGLHCRPTVINTGIVIPRLRGAFCGRTCDSLIRLHE
jgi:Ohr subfamily peroxiredoxin